jgi:hypothetical protein
MIQRKQWNPFPSILYGVAFGALAGALMARATNGGDRWPIQARTIVEITMITALACVAVSYVKQFISN